jgi:Na+/H+ antiporter NhaD/arsenite permease-like protein
VYTIIKEKNTFKLTPEEKKMLDKFRKTDPKTQIKDKKLMFKSLIIFLGAIVGFTLPPNLGVDPAVVSLIAGAIMLIAIKASDKDMDEVFKKMEWGTIFFFIGMFILVYALESIGVIDLIGTGIMSITKIPGISSVAVNIIFIILIIWIPLLLTGVMSAVPMAMIMVPIVQTLIQKSAEINIQISPLIWWALVFGTCFGGNMTIVGSAANIVVSGMSEKIQRGRITFSNYIRYSAPIVIMSGTIATGYILLRFLVF